MGTLSVVTAAEMAASLEAFELRSALDRAANAEKEAADLRAALQQKERDHVDDVSALKRSGADPVATVVAMLEAHPGLVERVAILEAERDKLTAELSSERETVTTLDEKLDEVAAAARTILAEKGALCSRIGVLEREIELSKKRAHVAESELKELRALNPQRMQKTLKASQQRVRELQEVNDRNRRQLSKLGEENRQLQKTVLSLDTRVEALDVALDKSCEMIDSGQSIPPVWEGGEWCIYGMSGEQMRLVIEHESGASLVFDSRLGCIGAPAAPAFVVEEAAAILERHRENQAIIDASKGKGGSA